MKSKKSMDAMDEMFVPYKEMFEAASPSPKPLIVTRPPSNSWIMWVMPIVFILALLAVYAYRKSSKEESIKSLGTSINLPHAAVPPQITVSTAPVQQKPKEFSSPQDLAKGVGAQLRDVLLTHKQVPSLAVAGIVSHAVRTLLGEDERAVDTPVEMPAESHAQSVREPKIEPVQPTQEVEEEPERPKRGKINAETDPGLLQLLKERGLNLNS